MMPPEPPPLKELQGYSRNPKTEQKFQRRGALLTFPFVILFFVSFIGGFEHWAAPKLCFAVAGVCFVVLIGSLVAVHTVVAPRSCISGQRMRRVFAKGENGVCWAVYIDDASQTYFCREAVRIRYGSDIGP